MKTKFLELISSILECNLLDNNISNNQEQIIEKVHQYNNFFKLNSEETKFRDYDGEVLVAPVPFASTGSRCKIAIVGLNPKFDDVHAADEKELAGGSWNEYADFYNSMRTFRYVMEERGSRFYTNKIKLMHALRTKQVHGIKEIKQIYNGKSEYFIFSELTDENPILLTEFIPFHSKKFNLKTSDIERAYSSLSGFKEYIDGIVKLIEVSLDEQGIIIIDGVNPSQLFKKMFGNEIEELYHETYKGKYSYSINNWRNKKVILTGGVIFGMSTPFNSHVYINNMIDRVYEYCPDFVMN